MKKLLSILLALAMIFTMVGCSKSNEETTYANRLEEIKARGYIVIGTEGAWSPWTYHDETSNELVGFDVEIGKAIAEYLGVEARFEESGWDNLLAGVQSGRMDIVCNGVGYTEDRALSFEMSDAYAYTKMVLIVSGDNTDINSFEDLNGKTTANTASSTYAQVAEGYGATVLSIDSFADTILLLTRGDIDATLNSEESYLDYLRANPDANIKVAATAEGETIVYPVMLGETELINAVNEALAQLRSSGKLAELSNKYFGGDITNK